MKLKKFRSILLLAAVLVLVGCSTAEETATPAVDLAAAEFISRVSATGKIVPDIYASLSVNTGGVVEMVLVSEGDAVEEGQLLVQIKGGEQARAAVAAAQFELTNAKNALNDLYDKTDLIAADALKRAEDAEDMLEDLLNRDLQEALALQAIADAQKAIDSREKTYNYTVSAADQDDVDIQRAQVTLAKDALEKAIEDFEPYENKPEDNLVRANFLARKAYAQQVYDDAVRKLNALLSKGEEVDIAVAEANLSTANAQLIEAERNLERVMDGPDDGEVALLKAQIAEAYEDYEVYKNGPDPDHIAAAEDRIANAEAQLAAAQAALDDLQLLAPFSGVVSDLNINENEWVAPGRPVMMLANLHDLRVETTDLSEIDVARIAVGDTAEVTFDAFPDLVLDGEVTRISPKAVDGPGVTYKVIIELDELPTGLRWGMTAFVDIDQE